MCSLAKPFAAKDAVGSTTRLPPARLMAALFKALASTRLPVVNEPVPAAVSRSVAPLLIVNALVDPVTLVRFVSCSVPPAMVPTSGDAALTEIGAVMRSRPELDVLAPTSRTELADD